MGPLKRVLRIGWKLLSLACVLYVGWILFAAFVLRRICDQPGAYSLVTNDTETNRKIKATVFTTDCGAMTATRTVVTFSNALVDGRALGSTVLVLTGVDCGAVSCKWTSNREFVVRYPRIAGVEFAVAKTHGAIITLHPE